MVPKDVIKNGRYGGRMERDDEWGTQHGSSNWSRFMSTGRVDDYLRYRGCMDDAVSVRNGTLHKEEDQRTVREETIRDKFW